MASNQNLESELKRRTRFAQLTHIRSCESTQDLSQHHLADHAEDSGDAIFWADHQTRGRGRQQRAWDDEAGLDLAVTFSVRLDLSNPVALPAALPVAVLQACEALAAARLRIKWPNDVYAGDRKLSGVLIDRDSARPDRYRIGVGLNVNRTTFPPELAGQSTSLRMLCGEELDREAARPLPRAGRTVDEVVGAARELVLANRVRGAAAAGGAQAVPPRGVPLEARRGAAAGRGAAGRRTGGRGGGAAGQAPGAGAGAAAAPSAAAGPLPGAVRPLPRTRHLGFESGPVRS